MVSCLPLHAGMMPSAGGGGERRRRRGGGGEDACMDARLGGGCLCVNWVNCMICGCVNCINCMICSYVLIVWDIMSAVW